MLIGMGIVYGFLAMLVVAIKAMSSLVQRFFPEMPGSQELQGDDPGTIAAIAAAVHHYRNKYQNPTK